jgi:hypothetical protein
MASVGALQSLRSFRRRLPWALGLQEEISTHRRLKVQALKMEKNIITVDANTAKHIRYGLCFLCLVAIGSATVLNGAALTVFADLGFAYLFYSWAKNDAPNFGKTTTSAIWFALAWPFFLVAAQVSYLLYTRGWQHGSISSLKFLSLLFLTCTIWIVAMGHLGLIAQT